MSQDEQFKGNEPQQGQVSIPFNIPFIYTNAVSVGLSATDVQLTATINGRPSYFIAMPFSTAKSLVLALQRALNDYESKTGVEIQELNDLVNKLNRR